MYSYGNAEAVGSLGVGIRTNTASLPVQTEHCLRKQIDTIPLHHPYPTVLTGCIFYSMRGQLGCQTFNESAPQFTFSGSTVVGLHGSIPPASAPVQPTTGGCPKCIWTSSAPLDQALVLPHRRTLRQSRVTTEAEHCLPVYYLCRPLK